jgi:hypothetical protein
VGVGQFDNLHTAMRRQPAHGALDRVVLQVADQHLVARLQAVVIADQRLQGFGGVAGERHRLGVHFDQGGELAPDLDALALFKALAHIHRIAAVDKRYMLQVLRLDRTAHATKVAIFQIDRTWLAFIALGDGLPVRFVIGIAGHGRGLLMAWGGFAVLGAQWVEQF